MNPLGHEDAHADWYSKRKHKNHHAGQNSVGSVLRVATIDSIVHAQDMVVAVKDPAIEDVEDLVAHTSCNSQQRQYNSNGEISASTSESRLGSRTILKLRIVGASRTINEEQNEERVRF